MLLRHFILPILWVLALFVAGCEDNNLGQIDRTSKAPFLSSGSITPSDPINIDTIGAVNGMYTVSAVVNVRAVDPDGMDDLNSVTASIFRPGAESYFFQEALRDDGIPPDLVANDSVFSATIQFDLSRAFAGTYSVQFSASDRSGLRSNVLVKSLFIIRRNSIPVISNLVAPDTIVRPSGGSRFVSFSLAVSDSDGYEDIAVVFFRRLSPPSANTILMFDDGDASSSGDIVAGDGIFTRILTIDSTAILGGQEFQFEAQDRFGAVSDSIVHTIVITP